MERKYTYEELLGMFRKEVSCHKNDADRVPARANDPWGTYHFAQKLYEAVYKDALHPSVVDEFKP